MVIRQPLADGCPWPGRLRTNPPPKTGNEVLLRTYETDTTPPNDSPDTVLHPNCKITAKQDPDLEKVIDAWPELPEGVRAGFAAMVEAGQSVVASGDLNCRGSGVRAV